MHPEIKTTRMKKSALHICAAALLCILTLSGCRHEHNELKHDHAGETAEASGEHAENAHSGEIVLEPDRAAALGVKTTRVQPGEFASVLEVSGQIAPLPSDESTVAARTSGIVHFAPGVTPGQRVATGQRIASISAKGMEQGYATEGARVAMESAKRELDRITPLAEEGIVSRRDYNAAKARYDEARAAATAVSAQAGSVATAPASGTLTSVLVNEGQYVGAGEPIARISSNSSLSLRADVPERHAGFVGSVNDAYFRTAYSPDILRISDFGGRLTATPTTAGAAGGYIPVYFTLKNNGSLISGTYCTVYLRGTSRTGVLTVPAEAIAEQQGQKFVYLREHPDAYRKQPVHTGESDGMNIEIISGLKAGDEVVTEGTTFVRLAETSGVVPEGHKH